MNSYFADKALRSITLPLTPPLRDSLSTFLRELMQAFREGDLCLPLEGHEALRPYLQEIPYLVLDHNLCYLHKAWVYETRLYQELQRLHRASPQDICEREAFEQALASLEEKKTLLPLQAQAIRSALHRSFTLISGGPGTGKSYTAAWLATLFARFANKSPLRIIATAPTGKAATHLHALLQAKGLSHLQSGTLHQLLHLHPGQERLHRLSTWLQADLLLVDEASMLDASLLAHLLQAVSPHTRLILLGDAHQLPPIGTGTLFADLAEYEGLFLQTAVRTEERELQDLATTLRQGLIPEFEALSFYQPWPTHTAPFLTHLVDQLPPLLFTQEPDPCECLRAWEAFRILCPFRDGLYGSRAFHALLYRHVCANAPSHRWWALPLLLTRNAPHLGLYNGTQGIVVGQSEQLTTRFSHLQEVKAYLGSSTTSLQAWDFGLLPDPELACCLSIHKSQGSEFKKVIALFPPGSEIFGREALYTAVTRSKKELQIIAPLNTLRAMAAHSFRKRSGLLQRLRTRLEGQA